METKFTPGPWRSDYPNDGAVYGTDGWPICEMGFASEYSERVAADARLIAAAPELFAALEEIVKNDPYSQSSAGIIARRALAKVTGEQS